MSGTPTVNAPSLTPPTSPNVYKSDVERPQTDAYALCDSPSGLLAYVMDAIRPSYLQARPQSPGDPRRGSLAHSGASRRQSVASVASSRSSPQSIAHSYSTPAQQGGLSTAGSSPVALRSPAVEQPPSRLTPQSSYGSQGSEANEFIQWTPTAVIDWTMIYWLPGPEVSLRWLANSNAIMPSAWAGFSMVPLGITHFREPAIAGTGTGKMPPQWCEAYHRIAMIRSREGRVRFPAWEAPAEIVSDIRELVGVLGLSAAGTVPHMQ